MGCGLKIILNVVKMALFVCVLFIVSCLSVSAEGGSKYIEQYIEESIKLRIEKINVYEFNCKEDEIFEVIDRVMKTNPDFYYIGKSFYYSSDNRGIVKEIQPVYKYSAQEIKDMKAYCDRELEKILFYIDENMSDFSVALALHEYLCENFSYDQSFDNYTMYDLLSTGRGTCQAFMLTYMELLNRVGIENSYAYSNEILHIWNLVRLDGEWYHVDITWDNIESGVSHKNFLLTDEEIIESGHIGFVNANGVKCTSRKYSSSGFHNTPYKYVCLGDGFVYIDNITRNVYFDKLDGSAKVSLYRVGDLWQKAEGRYFANSFSYPLVAGSRVYFNTKNKIFEIDENLDVNLVEELGFDIWKIANYGAFVGCYTDKDLNDKTDVKITRSMDADGDGEVTVLDMALLSGYIENKSVGVYKYNVDANGDCRLNAEDLEALASLLLVIDKSAV